MTIHAEDHLRLAWKIAASFFRYYRFKWHLCRLDLEDMQQEAVIALMCAAGKFDPSRPNANWPALAAMAIRRRLRFWLRYSAGPIRQRQRDELPIERAGIVLETLEDSSPNTWQDDSAETVSHGLGKLHPTHSRLLMRLYGIGCDKESAASIGRSEGCSRQAVEARKRKALQRLMRAIGGSRP